jgi:hypothetical protein
VAYPNGALWSYGSTNDHGGWMNGAHALDEILNWFDSDELEPCSRCNRRHLLRVRDAGATVCFGCGSIEWPGAETAVAANQGRDGP